MEETQKKVIDAIQRFYEIEKGNRITEYNINGLLISINNVLRDKEGQKEVKE